MGDTEFSRQRLPRVVLADDNDVYGQILSLTLESAGMQVVQRVMSGRQAIEATLEHKPDIVLMDIVMPEMDGLAALSVIKFFCPEMPVFMITALEDPLYLARAGELGAEGYYSKSVRGEELIGAIHEVISKGARSKSRSNPNAQPSPIFRNSTPKGVSNPMLEKKLTRKEIMILSLIAKGLDNQSMIDKMHITNNTLKTHIRNIFQKLKVKDRTQAAIWAVRHGYGVES